MDNDKRTANDPVAENVEPLIFPRTAKTRIWRPTVPAVPLSKQPVLRLVK